MREPPFSPSAGSVDPQSHQVVEGLRVRLAPAPPMRRLLALCADIGLVTVAVYGLVVAMLILFGALGMGFAGWGKGGAVAGAGMLVLVILFVLASAVIYHIYFIYNEFRTATTPGKKLFGLKVVSVDGARLTMGQVVIRELLRSYVDVPLVFPALISVFSTAKKQRVGDLAANTMVVHSRDREDAQKFMYVKQEEYHLLMEHLKPGPVPRDLREAYMRFAYGEFIVRREAAPIRDLEDWEARVKKLLPEAGGLGLNQQTVLRFFAEYCFQAANEETAAHKR